MHSVREAIKTIQNNFGFPDEKHETLKTFFVTNITAFLPSDFAGRMTPDERSRNIQEISSELAREALAKRATEKDLDKLIEKGVARMNTHIEKGKR